MGIGKLKNWFKNIQTFSDMERNYKNFKRNKTTPFIQINNRLIDGIRKNNFRDID